MKLSVRARLTALYAGLFLAAGAVLLWVSYALVESHFDRTLTPAVAADALSQLRGQYLLALLGTTLVALVLGYVVAGRVLRPLSDITATARRVSQERLDERIALTGPDDELRELAETFDGMLDRLEAAFASQRRFVANASHELRTPLTVIRAEVDVALADPDATVEELRAMGEAVREAVVRSDQLLDALLTLARSEAGVSAREPVDLAETARLALAQPADGLTVEAELAPAWTQGDRRLLERLVANLVENAVRHNVSGGWLRVRTQAVGDRVRVEVENTGAPIPPEAAARLVEPFQRLERRGDGPPGAGLGLSIVRTVAEAHGGTLEVAPRGGGGLCVRVELPSTPGGDPPAGRPAAAGPSTGTRPLART